MWRKNPQKGKGIMDDINRRFEERGFFRRLGDMFRGLGKPRDTREYRLARIELQRLAAPLVAIALPLMFGVVLAVVTAVSSQPRPVIPIDIPPIDDDPPKEKENPYEEPPPPDPEPVDYKVEITVDTPAVEFNTPAPTPVQLTPTTKVSTKPAPVDAVAMVKSPVSMKDLRSSRTPGAIGLLTNGSNSGGGDPNTEAAVMKVLWWLKARQNADGSWGERNKIANTALAVLTYLAHGEHPGSRSPFTKDFGPVVQQAVDYLIGNLHVGKDDQPHFTGSDGNEYSFLIATYALCETFAMTQNPNCKEAAGRCLRRIVENQSATGGWDYKVNRNSTRDDLSFAGWAIQALKAGKMAGLRPEGMQTAINKAVNCLRKRSYSKSAGFTYTPTANNNGGSAGLAGVGTLAMQFLGKGGEAEARNALDVMRDWSPGFTAEDVSPKKGLGGCPQYYCYYATQCKYQAGMKAGATKDDEAAWAKWNMAMRKLYPSSIIDVEEKVADWSGKGHRQGYYENKDVHSTRPYMDTCLAALQLMVYYRYMPTTSVKAGADELEDAATAKNVDNSADVPVAVNI